MSLSKCIPLFLILSSFILFLAGCGDDSETPTGITSLQPSSGVGGMRVVINGNQFGDSTSSFAVTFNGQPATIESIDDEQIAVITPDNVTTGPVELTIGSTVYSGPTFKVLELEENVNLSNGFSMDAGIATIGSAFIFESELGTTVLRLTPAKSSRVGVGYYGAKVPVINGFETTFDFRVFQPGRPDGQGGEVGADGFSFIIHNDSDQLRARGFSGGSLGYAGIENSVAIEFDIYQNQAGEGPLDDPNGNHISVQTNTDLSNPFGPTFPELNYSLGYTTDDTPNVPEFITNGNQKHTARITYTPGQLQIYLDNSAVPVLTVEMTLSDYINTSDGKAYVGFTGTTGRDWGWAAQDILNWSLEPVE